MKTIRMPRRMGEITERLPAPQYDNQSAAVKRTVSQPHLPLKDHQNAHKKTLGVKASDEV